MEKTHEELKSLIAPYVLGVIPEDEAGAIRSHIVTCDECMADAERFAEAAASLTHLVGAEELPAGFEKRVIAAVRPEGEPALPPKRKPVLRRVLAGAVALLVIAVAALTGAWLDVRNDLDESQTLAEALFNSVPGVELNGAAAGQAKLITSEDGAVFVARDMQPAPGGSTYQLWYLDDGVPSSAGTFDTSRGVAVLRVPRGFEGHDAAAVTIEPIGGSEQPTTEPILAST